MTMRLPYLSVNFHKLIQSVNTAMSIHKEQFLVSDETSLKVFSELAKAVLDEPTPDQFVAHIAMRILQPLDCRGTILGLVRNEGFLDLIGTHGYEKSATSPFARIPLWTPHQSLMPSEPAK